MTRSPSLGLAGTLARAFIGSRLTPLLVVGSVLLGLLALVILPREEEPQIKVPVFDIFVAMPGASAAEVESRVSAPLERLTWEIPGVDVVTGVLLVGSAAWTAGVTVYDERQSIGRFFDHVGHDLDNWYHDTVNFPDQFWNGLKNAFDPLDW